MKTLVVGGMNPGDEAADIKIRNNLNRVRSFNAMGTDARADAEGLYRFLHKHLDLETRRILSVLLAEDVLNSVRYEIDKLRDDAGKMNWDFPRRESEARMAAWKARLGKK